MSNLIISEVSKVYPNGYEALKKASFTADSKEAIALCGASGAGKSTLLRCINRLIDPTSGEITLNGIKITQINEKQLMEVRRQIGMVFQEFNLVNRISVLHNVLAGRLGYISTFRAVAKLFSKADVEKAEEILEKVGLYKFRFSRADKLSGGQRQRVGIARALMQEPKILLADEPISNLDPKIGKEIINLLSSLAKESGVPLLISIHNVKLAMDYCTRIVGLRDGVIVFDGSPDKMDFDEIYGVSS